MLIMHEPAPYDRQIGDGSRRKKDFSPRVPEFLLGTRDPTAQRPRAPDQTNLEAPVRVRRPGKRAAAGGAAGLVSGPQGPR